MAVMDKKESLKKQRKKGPDESIPFELYEDVERYMDDNNWEELMNIAKSFKLKGHWSSFIGYNYCQRRCTFLHELLRRSNTSTIVTLLDYLLSVMGKENFDKLANHDFDKTGRNCLTIAAKHCEPMLILSLIQDYTFDVSHYSIKCGMSALSYVLKRKKHDLAVECISKINPDLYDETGYMLYRRDLDLYKENLINANLINPHYLNAVTEEYTHIGRISRIVPPLYELKRGYGEDRLQQILRHLASQLYFRWKYHLNIEELEDVQVLCVEQPLRKPILFITTSPTRLAHQAMTDFQIKTFHTMLASAYTTIDNDVTIERLSRRFSKKMKHRVWGRNISKHSRQSRAISHLIECDDRKVHTVIIKTGSVEIRNFEAVDNTAYLVTIEDAAWQDSHGELLLATLFDYFKLEVDITGTIYGKGRPCMTCFMQLKETNVTKYNVNPGLFQLPNVKKLKGRHNREKYLDMIYTTPCHVTCSQENDVGSSYPDYDTESDSDIELTSNRSTPRGMREKKEMPSTSTST